MARTTKSSGKKGGAADETGGPGKKAAAAKPAKAGARTAKARAEKPAASASKAKATEKSVAGRKKNSRAKASAGRTQSAAKTTGSSSTAKAAGSKKRSADAKPSKAAPKSSGKGTAAPMPWLKNYPEGVPAEIGPLEHASIGEMLLEACQKFGSRPAFTCMGATISFADLDRLSMQLACYLQSRGIEKGARVALMMPNILQYPVAMMAVLRAGYVVVNVNPLYTARELEHQLDDAGATAIVILENFANTLQKVVGKTQVKTIVVASMGDLMGFKGHLVNFVVRKIRKMVPAWSLRGKVSFNEALKQGEAKTFRKPEMSPDDVAFLQYTGGTTGVSKGATLLHRNILANVAQNGLWVDAIFENRKRPDPLVYICALPLYHIFALTVNALTGMQQGGHNILIPNPRDIPAFVKEMKAHPFHIFPGLNTLFNGLLNNEAFQKLDFSKLILTVGGGMAVQKSVAERWKKLTGSNIAEGYGLSETSPVATANRFDSEKFTGTIGLPLPSTEIAIRNDDGKDVGPGDVGEICIRGPQVMAGYWNRPDETEKVMTKDGFFRSGDMGFMDEGGYVKIVDRKKDMILVSGFNVYPNEIEEVVAQHPGVLEVAAVGVADEHSGEVPKLFVVRKDPSLTEKDILDYARENLTGYKRPRHVEFRDELPKTNVGKILRRELR